MGYRLGIAALVLAGAALGLPNAVSAAELDAGTISCTGSGFPTSDSGTANTETTGDTVEITVHNISVGSQITFNVTTSNTSASVGVDDDGGVDGTYSPNKNLTNGHDYEVVFTATSGDGTATAIFTLTRQNPPGIWQTWSASCGQGSGQTGKRILATKAETSSGPYSVGEDIEFLVTAINTGTVSYNASISDADADELINCSPSNPVTGNGFEPGDVMTCEATYEVTQDDLDAGSYENCVTATGTGGGPGGTVTSEACVTVFFEQNAQLETIKEWDSNGAPFDVGDDIVFTVTVENTGNVTLTGVDIEDATATLSGCDQTLGSATLGPTEILTCTATHVVTALEVAEGTYTNTATGSSSESDPDDGSDTVDQFVTPDVGLSLTKTADQPTFDEDDTTIGYTYTVTNDSDVVLTNLAITDDLIASVSCDSTTLQPSGNAGDSTTCTGTYGITPVDILAGQITNNAVATAQDDGDTVFSNQETVTVTYVGPTIEDKVDEVTRSFLFRRMDRLISDGPDRARLLRKQADRAFCGSGGGGADLGQIYAEADDEGMTAFGEVGCSLIGSDRFDLWLEGNFTTYDSDYGDGSFAVGYVGFDWMVSENLLIGFLGQFDWMSQDENGDDVEGWGWMIGPYVSAELVQNLFFDARFAWGRSDNDVTVNLAGVPFSGDFDTERWLASARLSGNLTRGNWRITPEVQVAYIEEKRKTFDVSGGGGTTTIDSDTLALGRLTAGPEIAYRFVHGDVTIEPQFAMRLIWDFLAEGDEVSGMPIYDDSPRGEVELGVAFRSASGVAARISGTYDGIGTGGFDAFSVNGWLNFPFR